MALIKSQIRARVNKVSLIGRREVPDMPAIFNDEADGPEVYGRVPENGHSRLPFRVGTSPSESSSVASAPRDVERVATGLSEPWRAPVRTSAWFPRVCCDQVAQQH